MHFISYELIWSTSENCPEKNPTAQCIHLLGTSLTETNRKQTSCFFPFPSSAYQNNDITEFEKILKTNHSNIMDDPFIREHIEGEWERDCGAVHHEACGGGNC